jgi:hypothetical protein
MWEPRLENKTGFAWEVPIDWTRIITAKRLRIRKYAAPDSLPTGMRNRQTGDARIKKYRTATPDRLHPDRMYGSREAGLDTDLSPERPWAVLRADLENKTGTFSAGNKQPQQRSVTGPSKLRISGWRNVRLGYAL